MEKQTYNGWTNYATWRVNLDIIDGMQWSKEENTFTDISTLADYIKDTVESAVTNDGASEGLAQDYAQAFISDVNYYEIAKSVSEAYPDIITGVETSDSKNIFN